MRDRLALAGMPPGLGCEESAGLGLAEVSGDVFISDPRLLPGRLEGALEGADPR